MSRNGQTRHGARGLSSDYDLVFVVFEIAFPLLCVGLGRLHRARRLAKAEERAATTTHYDEEAALAGHDGDGGEEDPALARTISTASSFSHF